MVIGHPTKRSSIQALRWSLIFAGMAALFALVAVSTGRESYRSWKVNQEIQGLQAQVDALEGRKLKVLDTIQNLGSSEMIDREARLRLDMQKPGERVILVQGINQAAPSWQATLAPEGPLPQAEPEKTLSNPQKWFRYFFVHDR